MFSYSIVMLINYDGALKYRVDGPEDTVSGGSWEGNLLNQIVKVEILSYYRFVEYPNCSVPFG